MKSDSRAVAPGRYERYWEELASSNDRHPANRLRYRIIVKALRKRAFGIPIQGSLLDAGCGDGSLIRHLLSVGFWSRVVGVDISAKAVERNVERARAAGNESAKLEFQVADLGAPLEQSQGLASQAGSFDLVVSCEVIEHVPDDGQYARNLFSLVREGGAVVLTTQGGPRFRMDREVLGHLRHYALSELTVCLEKAGFEILDAWRTGFPWLSVQKRAVEFFFDGVRNQVASGREVRPWVSWVMDVLSFFYRFSVRGLGPQLVVIARKKG